MFKNTNQNVMNEPLFTFLLKLTNEYKLLDSKCTKNYQNGVFKY